MFSLENTLILVYKVAKKLYPKIINLLPTSRKELEKWITSFSRGDSFGSAVLREITLNALEMNAECFREPKLDHSKTNGVLAAQQFVKGSTVLASPLLLMERAASSDVKCVVDDSENEQECKLSNEGSSVVSLGVEEKSGVVQSKCLTQEELLISLCPLSLASRIDTVNLTIQETSNVKQPNVELQWNSRNKHNADALKKPLWEVTKVSQGFYDSL